MVTKLQQSSRNASVSDMKALVYHGPGRSAWENKPMPHVENPTDVIVQVQKTTICGTDLHILKGDVPTVTDGRVLGHEGTGTVVEVGAGVSRFKVGDRALISCITACGACEYCRRAMYSHCKTGGWVLGNTIDGTQAEYVRIPHADMSLYEIPEGVDEETMVLLSDILPTGYECGVLNGQVKPGDTVAIVGSGPIGLAALLTAQLYSPSEIIVIDLDDNRLEVAKKMGATRTVNSTDGKAAQVVSKLTAGRGVDVAIEAVGLPTTFGNLSRYRHRRRTFGKHRGAREQRRAPHGTAVVSQYCPDHQISGHLYRPGTTQDGHVGENPTTCSHQPPLQIA